MGALIQITDVRIGALIHITDVRMGALIHITDVWMGALIQITDVWMGALIQITDVQMGALIQITDIYNMYNRCSNEASHTRNIQTQCNHNTKHSIAHTLSQRCYTLHLSNGTL